MSPAPLSLFSFGCGFQTLSCFRRMFSLADYLRQLAERGICDVEDVIEKYEAWVQDHRYMVMFHEREAWKQNAGQYEYVAVKCLKKRK